jgi:succinate dehydrogenase flavin-adding protein (antitoxin of CptAB toxin-antitoxin module)
MWAPKDGSSDTKHEMFQPQDPSNKPSLADDPWAIPLQNPQADPDPNEIPLAHYRGGDTAHPEGRNPNEDTETMRARLVYQSRKRGTLEMEMLASTFIDAGKLKSMSREDMLEYDRVCRLTSQNPQLAERRTSADAHCPLRTAPDAPRLDHLLLGDWEEGAACRVRMERVQSSR